MELAARNMISWEQIFPYEINLYDLALCIDNNDKHMTCRAYSLYLSLVASFAPSLRLGAN